MEPTKVEGMNVKMQFDYKGGNREITDTMPIVSENLDYFTQYAGIWRILFNLVTELKAKKILEFGTREGYSTRLFSKILDITGGTIFTVDKDEPKTPFTEKNIVPIKSMVEDLDWSTPVDILYIDDWHDGYHVYCELERFARLAKVVMLHDVSVSNEVMNGMLHWCKVNMMDCGISFQNGCGLGIIYIEKSGLFYTNKNETSCKKGGAE